MMSQSVVICNKIKPLSSLDCHYLDASVYSVFLLNETHTSIFDAYKLFECFYFCLKLCVEDICPNSSDFEKEKEKQKKNKINVLPL